MHQYVLYALQAREKGCEQRQHQSWDQDLQDTIYVAAADRQAFEMRTARVARRRR